MHLIETIQQETKFICEKQSNQKQAPFLEPTMVREEAPVASLKK